MTFHFTGIDWTVQHKIQYTYLMESLDEKCSQASLEPKAEYRKIPYGSYTLKIRAVEESNQWNQPP